MAILSEKDSLYKALMATEGKAEIINGQIVEFESAGFLPGHAATEIRMSLRDYAKQSGNGESFGGFVGFLCDLHNRQSFCTDAAFYTGAEPTNPWDFCPNRQFSPSKCALKMIMGAALKPPLRRKSRIISRRARSWCGTLICCTKKSSLNLSRPTPTIRSSFGAASWLMQAPPCPDGRSRLTCYFRRHATAEN